MRAGRPRTHGTPAHLRHASDGHAGGTPAPPARPRPRHARVPLDAPQTGMRAGRPRTHGTPAPPAYTWLNHSAFRYKVAVVFAFDVLQSPIFHMPQRPVDPLTGGDQHQRRHQRKQESQSVGKQQEERIEHYRFGAFDQPCWHRHRRGFAP
jgi:hypothetical protein